MPGTALEPPEPATRRCEEPRLPLAGHLEELRRRLAVGLAALLLGVGVGWTQMDRLLGWLRRPAEPFVEAFAYFTPTEPLFAYVKLAVLAGLILAMPVLLWQVWAFIRSGLTPRERRYGALFVVCGSGLFVAGAAFAYFALVPWSLRVLLGLGEPLLPVLSIDRYLSFVTTIIVWCGAVFELPAILFLLAKVGIVTPEWLRQSRPYAILVLVILAAIITPTTDPVTLLLVALPLIVLYELSILVTRWAMPSARG